MRALRKFYTRDYMASGNILNKKPLDDYVQIKSYAKEKFGKYAEPLGVSIDEISFSLGSLI